MTISQKEIDKIFIAGYDLAIKKTKHALESLIKECEKAKISPNKEMILGLLPDYNSLLKNYSSFKKKNNRD